MAKSFYAILIRWNEAPIDSRIGEIDNVLGVLGDWVRFSGYNWIVWSDSTAGQIYQALTGKLTQSDSELVVKFDPNAYSGWAPKWIDDWITERRDGSMRVVNALTSTSPLFPPFDPKR